MIGTPPCRGQNPSMERSGRRAHIEDFFTAAVAAIDPERLTTTALEGWERETVTLIAIGKAGPAMVRGAASAIGEVTGICVTSHESEVPEGVELMIGDHPIPGERSYAAGQRVLEVVSRADTRIVALISGGGSSLCELPRPGIPRSLVSEVAHRLVDSGASIAEINLVRRHLSAIKGGGLLAGAAGEVTTFAISDVCGAPPAVIASGPTIPQDPDVEGALRVMHRLGIEVTPGVLGAMETQPASYAPVGDIHVIADGHTAARGFVDAARKSMVDAEMIPGWLSGPVDAALDSFTAGAATLRVASGEPEVEDGGGGRGGRNTHAALLAAKRIAGTGALFAALATDGVDGSSGSAGAIVDGDTVARGGDPTDSLAASNSAHYLESTGDLVVTGPTGTNVADLWVFWPGSDS